LFSNYLTLFVFDVIENKEFASRIRCYQNDSVEKI